MPAALRGDHYKTSDYVAMIDAVRSNVPALERVVFLGTDSWKTARCCSPGRASALSEREEPAVRRPGQHPATAARPAFPKAARSVTTPSEQRGFIGEGCRYTRRPCVYPGAVLSLFWDGARRSRLHDAWSDDCGAGPDFDAAVTLRTVQEERCTSFTGCRRCSLPNWRCRTSIVRPLVPPHRNHGRLPLSDCRDEAMRIRDAYGRSDDLLRHD